MFDRITADLSRRAPRLGNRPLSALAEDVLGVAALFALLFIALAVPAAV